PRIRRSASGAAFAGAVRGLHAQGGRSLGTRAGIDETGEQSMSWRPQRAIEIIAGTPPGGGLDRSARALQNAIAANGLVDVPVTVVNVGGEGGRKAWRHVEGFTGDGHVIGISSPNMLADYLTGVTTADPGRFVPLAILYSEYIAFVVRADAPIKSG